MKQTSFAAFTFTTLLAGAASADQVINDNLRVNGNLCAGVCDSVSFNPNVSGIAIQSSVPGLEFLDSGDNPQTDWLVGTNNFSGTNLDAFYIEDQTNNTTPFGIQADANDNALFINQNGDIGMGTMFPGDDLHIAEFFKPSILFEQLPSLAADPYQWELGGTDEFFYLNDGGSDADPFRVYAMAPDQSFALVPDGALGLGTIAPEGKLHTKADGVQLIYFESGDGGPVQVRFRTDSENRRFLAVDNANNVKSQIIFKDNEILFTGQTDSGANRWMTIGPSGIVSQGPTCNPGPCDATFDKEAFDVPSIEDHAAYMWENQHLWGVGPTSPGQPFNLTQKAGGMLHELEVAHIYIEQLHTELQAQKAEIAELRALVLAD